MSVREEELKNNAIDLMVRSEELDKGQAEIGLLKEELTRLHKEGRPLRHQLDEAKEYNLRVSVLRRDGCT